jgi:hypothetical protein
MSHQSRAPTMSGPATYVIRVRGALEPEWSDRLGGMAIAVHCAPDGPVTTLSGQLPDQAALHGVLMGLYGLGLPVLSVEAVAAI